MALGGMTMKRLAYAAILSAMAFSFGGAWAADGPMAPIDAFLVAFNKGDIATMTAAQRDSNFAIIDEVPPHIWLGPKAVDAWLASLDSYDKAHGRTDGAVAISKPQVMTVEGDRAYAVAPAVYTFKAKGKAMRETATMTFALHRTAAGWKIAGWTWNGTVPRATGK
jgi:hypothetical protein